MLDVTERKVLAITTFVSACICFAPGQWVSGLALLIASAVLWVRYVRSLPKTESKTKAKQERQEPPEAAGAS